MINDLIILLTDSLPGKILLFGMLIFVSYIFIILFSKDKKEEKIKNLKNSTLIAFAILVGIVIFIFAFASFFEDYNPDLQRAEQSM